jgi:hypothetical protein
VSAELYSFDPLVLVDPALCSGHGSDSCESCAPGKPSRFRQAADVMTDAPPDAVVEGMFYRERITTIIAESGVGKSFVILGASAAIADPNVSKWAGREVLTGSVALILFERDAVGVRLRALAEEGHDLENVYVLQTADTLSPITNREGLEFPSPGEMAIAADIESLAADLDAKGRPPIVAAVFDTLRAGMTGAEESSRDMSAYLRAVGRVMRPAPKAAVGIVHHTGWQDGDQARMRERGSSALRGNVDVTLTLEVADDSDPENVRLVLRVKKNRDEEKAAPLYLVRRRVVLNGFGPNGRLVTSCVVEPDTSTREGREAERAAKVEAAATADALAVLGAVRDYPEATNIEKLRELLGLKKDRVSSAVRTILARRWAYSGRRGEPYTLTPEGRAALSGRTGPNGTEQDPGPVGPVHGVSGTRDPSLGVRFPGTCSQEVSETPETANRTRA